MEGKEYLNYYTGSQECLCHRCHSPMHVMSEGLYTRGMGACTA